MMMESNLLISLFLMSSSSVRMRLVDTTSCFICNFVVFLPLPLTDEDVMIYYVIECCDTIMTPTDL